MTSARSGQDLAAAALSTVGAHDGVTLLAEGMSSSAWRGTVDGSPYVVRVPKNDGRRPTPRYEDEARLLTDLAARGVPVAVPSIVEIGDVACSVAPEIPGEPVRPGEWTPELVGELHEALRILHETPPDLAVETDVVARFHLARTWPFDGADPADHPVADRWPERLAALVALAPEIRRAGAAPATVVHTDLHWDHILVADGRLMGILDFGDAFAGPPGWDHACLRYYHGPDVTGPLTEDARLLSIAFVLYKLDKTPERIDVVERVDAVLRDALLS